MQDRTEAFCAASRAYPTAVEVCSTLMQCHGTGDITLSFCVRATDAEAGLQKRACSRNLEHTHTHTAAHAFCSLSHLLHSYETETRNQPRVFVFEPYPPRPPCAHLRSRGAFLCDRGQRGLQDLMQKCTPSILSNRMNMPPTEPPNGMSVCWQERTPRAAVFGDPDHHGCVEGIVLVVSGVICRVDRRWFGAFGAFVLKIVGEMGDESPPCLHPQLFFGGATIHSSSHARSVLCQCTIYTPLKRFDRRC